MISRNVFERLLVVTQYCAAGRSVCNGRILISYWGILISYWKTLWFYNKNSGRFAELTGNAGDLAIIHPYMMHRTAPNPSGRARFACHPAWVQVQSLAISREVSQRLSVAVSLLLAEPMDFARDDGTFSLCELVTLKALGLERFDFKVPTQRFLVSGGSLFWLQRMLWFVSIGGAWRGRRRPVSEVHKQSRLVFQEWPFWWVACERSELVKPPPVRDEEEVKVESRRVANEKERLKARHPALSKL